MHLRPTKQILLKTALSQNEIVHRLELNVEKDKSDSDLLFNNNFSKPFIGYFSKDSLEIRRVGEGRTRFIAFLSGTFQQDKLETKINIKMQMELIGFIFFILICFFALSLSLIFYLILNKFDLLMLSPFGIILFGYLIMISGFNTDSRDLITDLRVLFDGEIIE